MKPVVDVKAEPKTSTVPIGNLKTQHISIKGSLKISSASEETSGVNMASMPKNNFHFDELKMVWKQLAFSMKDKGLETIYIALIKRDPKVLNNFEIHYECDNQIQIDIIQSNLSEIIEFIRQKLQNYSIQLFFEVIEKQEENAKLLTGKDKFNVLAKKNANLYSLQKTFNLDIDY